MWTLYLFLLKATAIKPDQHERRRTPKLRVDFRLTGVNAQVNLFAWSGK